MKQTIASVMLAFTLLCAVECQWYYRTCGVTDIENATSDEFDCLWEKSNRMASRGRTTCVVGGSIMIVGGIAMIATDPCCSQGVFMLAGLTFFVGGGITILGLPAWVAGAGRKSQLKGNIHSQNQALKTILISPVMQRNHLNNSHIFGIGATISF